MISCIIHKAINVTICVGGASSNYEISNYVSLTGNVGLIQLNRPRALNALCDGLMQEVGEALASMDNDPTVDAIVITGMNIVMTMNIVIIICKDAKTKALME